MAYRLYITPSVTFTQEGEQARRVKYFSDPAFNTGNTGQVSNYAAMYYGAQPVYLVAASLLPADDTNIAAQADVYALPFDLSPQIGGGQTLQNAKNALEAVFIPAQNINAQTTWLSMARLVGGMFQFMQRVLAIAGTQIVIDSSAKLNAQWNAIPVDPWQNAILAAALSFGYGTSFIQSNTQVRAIIDNFGNQWGAVPFQLGAFTF